MKDLKTKIEKYHYESCAAILFILLLLQRFILDFKYFPLMDDWFLYYGRSVFPAGERILDLTTRPFAGLADKFIITPSVGGMVLIEIVLLIMLAFSAYFFVKVFNKTSLAAGSVMMLVLVLTPTGFEGLYWIAAAARIIPTLFFISASAFLLTRYYEKKQPVLLILYALCCILAVGFYEIFIPIYLIINIYVIIINKKRGRDLLTAIIPIAAAGGMAIYYMINRANPQIADRASSVPFGEFFDHAIYTIRCYKEMLISTNIHLLFTSFTDGLRAMSEHWAIGILLVLFAAAFGFFSKRSENRSVIKGLILGILLFCAGAALNFTIGYVRLPFRLAVPLLPGVAVIADTLISLIPGKYTYRIFVSVLTLIFSICNIGQLTLYSYTNTQDDIFGERLARHAPVTDKHHVTFVCGANQYWYNDRPQHFEYVKAVTENYAAITGMIQYKTGVADINNVIPLYEGAIIGEADYLADWINIIYFDNDGNIHTCTVTEQNGNYSIVDENNNPLGTLTAADGSYVYNNVQ